MLSAETAFCLINIMPLTREQKEKIIDDLREKISRQKAMVFAAVEGLKAEELFELRKELKKEDCLLAVAKKTLADKVLDRKSTRLNSSHIPLHVMPSSSGKNN